MFRAMPTPVPPTHDVPPPDLIPLTHLQLDLDPPVEGWAAYLKSRSIPVAEDDLAGRRLLVRRQDAYR